MVDDRYGRDHFRLLRQVSPDLLIVFDTYVVNFNNLLYIKNFSHILQTP